MYIFRSNFAGQGAGATKAYRREPTIAVILIGLAGFEQLFTGCPDPLLVVCSYFTLPKEKMTVEQEEEMMHSDRGAYCMAHNGWVMSDDPLRNFAEPGTNILSWFSLLKLLS